MSTTRVTTFRRVCDCCGSQIGALEESSFPPPSPRVVLYQLGAGIARFPVLVVRADDTSQQVDVCDLCLEREP